MNYLYNKIIPFQQYVIQNVKMMEPVRHPTPVHVHHVTQAQSALQVSSHINSNGE